PRAIKPQKHGIMRRQRLFHEATLAAFAWTCDRKPPTKSREEPFYREGKNCTVRQDGRTNVINNPESIAEDLIKLVQPMFKTALQQKPDDRTQNKAFKGTEETH
ncbi:MAG: hypothetical protein CFE26_12835, partial [Verrucomicrobiales bacterium VVV1]